MSFQKCRNSVCTPTKLFWHRSGMVQLPSSLQVKLVPDSGENHTTRLGIQDNFLYCYQKAFISTKAPDTIPSSGLWRELTIGMGHSQKQRCNIDKT